MSIEAYTVFVSYNDVASISELWMCIRAEGGNRSSKLNTLAIKFMRSMHAKALYKYTLDIWPGLHKMELLIFQNTSTQSMAVEAIAVP